MIPILSTSRVKLPTECSLEDILYCKLTWVTCNAFISLGEKKNILSFQNSVLGKSYLYDSFIFTHNPKNPSLCSDNIELILNLVLWSSQTIKIKILINLVVLKELLHVSISVRRVLEPIKYFYGKGAPFSTLCPMSMLSHLLSISHGPSHQVLCFTPTRNSTIFLKMILKSNN